MNFWDKITGADMDREFKDMEQRVRKLPDDYVRTWEEIKKTLCLYGDFTGRNLMPVFTNVLCFLEESAADGQSAAEVFGDDVQGFCTALADEKEMKSYREKWRDKLNKSVAEKLTGAEG